ncbi:hypothetical protein ACWGKQ_51700, partial [Streptomyces sp. NPDC054770]
MGVTVAVAPAVAVGDGVVLAPRVAVALGEALGEALADAPGRADGDVVTGAAGAADVCEAVPDAVRGLCSGAAAADDSPAVRFVRSWPPCVPSPGEEEKGRPVISASAETAPTAPTAATTYV